MLSFLAGVHKCWPDFEINIDKNLSLSFGQNYYLHGANGSGKSSFIKRILLPALQQNHDYAYSLYLQQHFHLQAYLIKAEAALWNPELRPKTMSDCLTYLLRNLEKAQKFNPKPVIIVADESPLLDNLIHYLQSCKQPNSLVYSVHGKHSQPDNLNTILFEPLSPKESKVRCLSTQRLS